MRNIMIFSRWTGLSLSFCLIMSMGGAFCQPLHLQPAPANAPQWETDPQPAHKPANMGKPIQLQVEKQGIPRALLYRQLQPKVYASFADKSKDLRRSLQETLVYLETLDKEPPSLQRIGAFSGAVSLDWDVMEKQITPEEQSYHSYQLMKVAVLELRSLANYWVTTERIKRVFRGTLREEEEDHALMLTKRDKIRTVLTELEKSDQLKKDLNAELPY